MYAATNTKSGSSIATFAIIAVFIIIFTSGLFSVFFENKLNEFFHYLDVNIKGISSLVKAIVFTSGIIWLISPVIIVCCVYTLVKDHRYDKNPSTNLHLKSDVRNVRWLSPQIDIPAFNPNFNDRDFDDFITTELEKVYEDLTARREGYLSIYNDGPLFLTEARDRLKTKMSDLLDYQDAVVLSMHSELQLKIITQIKFYQHLMKHDKNDDSSIYLLNEYLNEMDNFYTEAYTAFTNELKDLDIQLQALSDDHFDRLQHLSNTLSKY